MLSSIIFQSPIHEGSLTLYSSFWTILILHSSVIWAITWVLVPLDTFSGFLWVVVAKAALFRGLLHINAARKLAAGHSMRWQQLFLRYFLASILLVHSRCTSLSVEFPGRSLWVIRYAFDLHLAYPRWYSSSKHPSQPFYLNITLKIVYSSSNKSISSAKTQGPIYNFRPLSLQ